LLCGDDYRVRERVGGFQSIGKVDINDLGKEGVGEKGDICVISRVGRMIGVA
jgi:hypothetical protein